MTLTGLQGSAVLIENLTVFAVLASVVSAYRWRRFQVARTMVRRERSELCYSKYAADIDDD